MHRLAGYGRVRAVLAQKRAKVAGSCRVAADRLGSRICWIGRCQGVLPAADLPLRRDPGSRPGAPATACVPCCGECGP